MCSLPFTHRRTFSSVSNAHKHCLHCETSCPSSNSLTMSLLRKGNGCCVTWGFSCWFNCLQEHTASSHWYSIYACGGGYVAPFIFFACVCVCVCTGSTAAAWEQRKQEETLQRTTLPPSVLSITDTVGPPIRTLERGSGGNCTVPAPSKAKLWTTNGCLVYSEEPKNVRSYTHASTAAISLTFFALCFPSCIVVIWSSTVHLCIYPHPM